MWFAAKVKGKQPEKKLQPARSSKKLVTVETVFGSDEEEVQYNPTLLNVDAKEKWKPYQQRGLMIQRGIDINQFNFVCDIVPLLTKFVFLPTVHNICRYSKLLTVEFYCNLNEDTLIPSSYRFHKVFMNEKWFKFSPKVINNFFHLTAEPEKDIED